MRIVMFSDSYWPRVNGVTVSVDSFARALAKSGHSVVILCPSYPGPQSIETISTVCSPDNQSSEEAIGPSLTIIRIPSYPVVFSKEDRIPKFHKFFWVDKALEHFTADIVHINSEFMASEYGFYYARRNNLPVVYTFHTMWEDYITNYIPVVPPVILRFIARMVLKNFCRRASSIIAPSTQILDVLKRYKVKKTAYLLPTGIDPEQFAPQEAQVEAFRARMIERYPQLEGKKILLFAGRIGKEKNLAFFTETLPLILERIPNTILILAGNGPDIDFFKELFKEKGISAHSLFTGYMDRKDLALAYAMSDVFVFPSMTETQGLVTIEAMLSGTPVVAIGKMGTITVMGGDNGGFMTRENPAEFAGRVVDLLTDAALYEKKVAEARRHSQAWTIDTMSGRLMTIYENTIQAFKANKKT